MKRRRALTLDANGVLLLPDPAFLRGILADFGGAPDDETCWSAHYEMIHLLDTTDNPDWPEMHRAFAAALGVPERFLSEAGPLAAEVYVGTPWVAAPGAASALGRLASDDCNLAVVSNTMHGEMEELLRRTGLLEVSNDLVAFSAVVDSQVIGFRKPDPRAFELALEAMEVAPSMCTHVGDSVREDVIGAQRAGLTPIHVDPLGLCSADDHGHTLSLASFAIDFLKE
jgi:putative hydrolase of the HAD superfamily